MADWCQLLSVLLLFYISSTAGIDPAPIKVSTYNLWNIMFNWDVRKLRIAHMMKEANPDIIVLQEVRGTSLDMQPQHSQLDDLQALLSEYRYSDFHPADKVTPPEGSYTHYGWEMEGMGILSKHPIMRTDIQHLTQNVNSPDKNKRIALYYYFGIRGVGTIWLAAVHMSYDRQQQCQNVAEIIDHVTASRMHHVIIVGDYNSYEDFQWPIRAMTRVTVPHGTPCYSAMKNLERGDNNLFIDAWRAVKSIEKGYTFSNMPTPGYESRPDRILASQYSVEDASLVGDGKIYASKFYYHIILNRFSSIISAAKDNYNGLKGRPCPYDCGPRASCRCGVCVSGGDTNACKIPHCRECTTETYQYFIVTIIIVTFLTLSSLHAVLRGLLVINSYHNYDLRTKLGFNCCLCHPELYTPGIGSYSRKIRSSFVYRLTTCYLPPFYHILVSFLALVTVCVIFRLIFIDVFELVYSILEEEFYPSDHLMLTAKLTPHSANVDNPDNM